MCCTPRQTAHMRVTTQGAHGSCLDVIRLPKPRYNPEIPPLDPVFRDRRSRSVMPSNQQRAIPPESSGGIVNIRMRFDSRTAARTYRSAHRVCQEREDPSCHAGYRRRGPPLLREVTSSSLVAGAFETASDTPRTRGADQSPTLMMSSSILWWTLRAGASGEVARGCEVRTLYAERFVRSRLKVAEGSIAHGADPDAPELFHSLLAHTASGPR
jgi:hypothetical protein